MLQQIGDQRPTAGVADTDERTATARRDGQTVQQNPRAGQSAEAIRHLRMHDPKAIPLAEDEQTAHGGIEMGWWILVVVVVGIAAWAVCAVLGMRRVIDQEDLRDLEDVQ